MSSEHDKNETSRFLGEGMSFKAKLIGILEVAEARGDRMCQEALSDLKMAIRAAGEHKQRIIINIAIDGLRLRDEKTGDSLYHHPVHKISFIAQDMTDSRAFGYIFGSPDTGHRFFGIKTDKAASQVVIAMRDLFQVVFALKKKEIELAKQHLDKSYCDNSSLFSDGSVTGSKVTIQDSSGKSQSEMKTTSSESKSSAPVVANLVDLELELNNLQQGISQIERLTPSDPFNSKNDPFGDSFTSYTPKPILPPPPSGRERSNRVSESSSVLSPKTPHLTGSKEANSISDTSVFHTSEDLSHTLGSSQEDSVLGDWFSSSLIKEAPLQPEPSKETPVQKDEEQVKQDILKQFDVFTDLDPLGTGKIKPYVHKKDFFQELKKPKKVLNDLVSNKQSQDIKILDKSDNFKTNLVFSTDPFGEDPFDKSDPFTETDPFNKDTFNVDFTVFDKEQKPIDLINSLKLPAVKPDNIPTQPTFLKTSKQDSAFSDTLSGAQYTKKGITNVKVPTELESTDEKKPEADSAPKPPPRPTVNAVQSQPPPLPPKKQPGDLCIKPPPRPPHSEEIHYDIIGNEETKSVTTDIISKDKGPPLPAPARKTKPNYFTLMTDHSKKKLSADSSEDDYLTPVPFPQQKEFTFSEKKISSFPSVSPQKSEKETIAIQQPASIPFQISKPSISTIITGTNLNCSIDNLNFMLSQLTLSGLNELAAELNIPSSELSNMTLSQITSYLSDIIRSKAEEKIKNEAKEIATSTYKTDFADFSNFNSNETHDKYAVFRELLAEELKASDETTSEKQESFQKESVNTSLQESNEDKYAALREIVEKEFQAGESDEAKKLEKENTPEETKEIFEKESEGQNQTETLLEDRKTRNDESKKESEHEPITNEKFSFDNESPKHADDFAEGKASDSASDAASGTSPEVEGANEATKDEDIAVKNWTVFDQPGPQTGEKLSLQSEEGVSPWSSDSKEFGNASPEWKQTVDSGSDNWGKQVPHKEEERWWDTSAEPEVEHYHSNRRSTDSFEDECYDYCRKPHRTRKKQLSSTPPGSHAAGGHSSSSRDVSPWEEEPRKLTTAIRKDSKTSETWGRHTRQYFEKCRDSWDEEDDYEYDEEHYNRYHWPERHGSRQIERSMYSRGRGWISSHWADDRHFWKQEMERKRHCCQDWEMEDSGKLVRHYTSGGWVNEDICSHKWPDNKYEEAYCPRDSQDSPWEDDYPNDPEIQSSRYLNLKHHWKRPSSASEVDKKADEMRSKQVQHYLGTGGSDGEKERRYKTNRRSRSRDACYFELNGHYKIDPSLTIRSHHRNRILAHHKMTFKGDNQESSFQKLEPSKSDYPSKKMISRKKTKETSKPTNLPNGNFSRKCTHTQPNFENNFIDVRSENLSLSHSRFSLDYGMETPETKSPTTKRPTKVLKQKTVPERFSQGSVTPDLFKAHKKPGSQSVEHSSSRRRSPFEDDFSPSKDNIETITRATDLRNEEEDYFCTESLDKTSNVQKKINSNRFSNNFNPDDGLKKSESVNIFARESDPFDDEFFSGSTVNEEKDKTSPKSNIRWTQNFNSKENDLH